MPSDTSTARAVDRDSAATFVLPPSQPSPPAAAYLPPAPAGTQRLFACSLGTGFVGTFEEVEAHEQRILAQQASGWGTVQGTVQVPSAYGAPAQPSVFASQAGGYGLPPGQPFYGGYLPSHAPGVPQWHP